MMMSFPPPELKKRKNKYKNNNKNKINQKLEASVSSE
jgi:hypothetical protein